MKDYRDQLCTAAGASANGPELTQQLNDIAGDILSMSRTIDSMSEVIRDRLYGSTSQNCENAAKQVEPDNLNSRLLAIQRNMREIYSTLDMVICRL